MGHALKIPTTGTRKEIYDELLPQIFSLVDDESDLIANLANISAALYEGLKVFWVGFYLRKGTDLVLGPFQGPIACTRIAVEPSPRGVCGASAASKEIIVVDDVEKFPGHIACSAHSRSEIVLPLILNGKTELVLDVDSEHLNYFSSDDADALSTVIEKIKSKHF